MDNAQQLMACNAIINFKCEAVILAISMFLRALKKLHAILSRLSLSPDDLTDLQP